MLIEELKMEEVTMIVDTNNDENNNVEKKNDTSRNVNFLL